MGWRGVCGNARILKTGARVQQGDAPGHLYPDPDGRTDAVAAAYHLLTQLVANGATDLLRQFYDEAGAQRVIESCEYFATDT
jgi:hypothetical protein